MPFEIGYTLVNRIGYWRGIPNYFRNFAAGLKVIAAAFGILILFGVAVVFTQGEVRLPAFLALTGAMVSLSPWPAQDWRYFNPLLPAAAIALFSGLQFLAIRAKRRFAGGEYRGPIEYRGLIYATIFGTGAVMTFPFLLGLMSAPFGDRKSVV